MGCPDGLSCTSILLCQSLYICESTTHNSTYNSPKLVRVSDTRLTAHVCLKQPSLKQMLHLHSCKISVETVSTRFPMLLSEGRSRVRCALARHYQKTDETSHYIQSHGVWVVRWKRAGVGIHLTCMQPGAFESKTHASEHDAVIDAELR